MGVELSSQIYEEGECKRISEKNRYTVSQKLTHKN